MGKPPVRHTIAIDPSVSARIYVGAAANPSDAFALKIVECFRPAVPRF